MNPSKPYRAMSLTETTYHEQVGIKDIVQKVAEKKWVVLRKTFFFFMGLGLYLVFSAL